MSDPQFRYGISRTFGTPLNAASERAREPRTRCCVQCAKWFWTNDPAAVRCGDCAPDEPDVPEVTP